MSSKEHKGEITSLLHAAGGRLGGADRLWELAYPELRRRARALSSRERPDHTLGATGIVNEAFVRLATQAPHEWTDRSHFYAAASNIMRHVLVDHARGKAAAKRGSDASHESFSDAIFSPVRADDSGYQVVAAALETLSAKHPRAALVVAFKVFGGLTMQEIADELGVTERTVRTDWVIARARLRSILAP